MEGKPTREKILELAAKTEEIKVSMGYYHSGELTWEEALMGCVILLQDELERFRARERRKYRLLMDL